MATGSFIFSLVLFIALCCALTSVWFVYIVIAFTAIHRRAQVKVMVELAAPGRGAALT